MCMESKCKVNHVAEILCIHIGTSARSYGWPLVEIFLFV
jgi:hypothetical protein